METEITEDTLTDKLLLKSISKLMSMIEKNKFDKSQKKEIYDAIQSFIKKDFEVSNELVKFLLTGWAVHSELAKAKESSSISTSAPK
jgi:hypothetical protein